MIRTILNQEQWERIAPELPGKVGDPGASAGDNRLFVEAVLWIARTGAPWRDLPREFGKWYSIYTRFWRWAQKCIWERIFKALSDDPDFEYCSSTPADGLILSPPFAPAACWWARTMAESTVRYSKSGSSDTAAKIRFQTPPSSNG